MPAKCEEVPTVTAPVLGCDCQTCIRRRATTKIEGGRWDGLLIIARGTVLRLKDWTVGHFYGAQPETVRPLLQRGALVLLKEAAA